MAVVRGILKFIGAVALVFIILMASFIAAWVILQNTNPSQTILYIVAMSAISGLLMSVMTVYRMIKRLRSATYLLLLTIPAMISLMFWIINYWLFIKAIALTEASWSKGIIDVIQQFFDFLYKFFSH